MGLFISVRQTIIIFSNASNVGMGLILFYYWTIIVFYNNSIVGMGLSAGMPAGGALAGQARCARGGRVPVEEPCTRRPEGGKPAVIPPSGLSLFPHGACFVGRFTCQWMKGRVVVIQVVRTTGKTLAYMNFAAVGAVFFVSVTGYVTRGLWTESRSARWTRGLICRVSD